MNAQDLIRHLQLLPHPEGGYYRETYRAAEQLTTAAQQPRHVSTAIYFLLEGAAKSHFHRIKSDELWFFHQGQPLEIVLIQGGQASIILLGNDFAQGAVPQAVVPAGTWFAARVRDEAGFGLVSCTVAPGFDFADFELAERAGLTAEFPQLRELIAQFTTA
ncbi:cupin domain-containing protein [Hymenobacter sp. 15J16-1T3B]|uniref:cupin domain-containing protein n=1 Tax=Hymenobacter sp. 15J16-1T3B TaxID=2886941 RepID=UPI001D110F2D|nr:cupin domain-containing protein [Hymenobacter sp. 15J16-1T3B]MCC3159818.1 cupin domain-containing protein [Hymenobacter sp. 15J16-1T3B]